jgi:hypothetical protein
MVRTTLKRAALLLVSVGTNSVWAGHHSVLPLPILKPMNTVTVPSVVAEGDTFPLTLIGSVEFSESGTIAFGDTDHDGANEIALTGLAHTNRIWEHQGDNNYSFASSVGSNFSTYAVGDVDQDGRSEIVGQMSGYLQRLGTPIAMVRWKSSTPSTGFQGQRVIWRSSRVRETML